MRNISGAERFRRSAGFTGVAGILGGPPCGRVPPPLLAALPGEIHFPQIVVADLQAGDRIARRLILFDIEMLDAHLFSCAQDRGEVDHPCPDLFERVALHVFAVVDRRAERFVFQVDQSDAIAEFPYRFRRILAAVLSQNTSVSSFTNLGSQYWR